MKNYINDVADVLTLNITTIAISFTNVESMLKIVLLIISIIYTTEKWIKARKDGEKGNK